MVLFRHMYRTNGYVEWRSSLFTKHWDVFSLVFLLSICSWLLPFLILHYHVWLNMFLCTSNRTTCRFNSTQYGLILHPFYGRFVLHSTTTKNRHSGLLMAIWIKLVCIKKIMIEISVFQIIIQMHGEYWNATTNDCKILDRDRQFI